MVTSSKQNKFIQPSFERDNAREVSVALLSIFCQATRKTKSSVNI